MQNAIWLLSIVAVLITLVAQPRWGGIAFLLVTMLAPYGIFSKGELSLRADLVLTPLMLALQVVGLSRTTGRASLVPITWLFLAWLLFTAGNTMTAGREIDFIGTYGYVRLVLVMIVFSWIPWRAEDANHFQFAYVLTSIPIGLLSIGQLVGVPFARTLSDSCYSPPSATVMEQQALAEQVGYLYRAVGVFGNVSPTATYFLLTICLTVSLLCSPYARSRKRYLAPALICSIGGGLATMSGTFIAGIALVLLLALFNAERGRRRKIVLSVAGTAALLAIAVTVARAQFEMVEIQLDYQWQRITGGNLLTNRYSTSEGILADGIAEIQDHLLLGRGWTVTDTFIGDSIYFSILYCSGILGSLLFAFGLSRLLVAAWNRHGCGRWALSWSCVLLLGGIGCTTLILGRLADGWWAMQGMLICQLAASHRPSLFSASERRRATLHPTAINRRSSPTAFRVPPLIPLRES